MADIELLKRLIEACDIEHCADEEERDRNLNEFYSVLEPEDVATLIAENEALRAERSAMTSALMRIVDLSNSGHGPMRSYRQMLDIAAEARQVLGLEVANGR